MTRAVEQGRALACPDKFRGSLSAGQAAEAMARGLAAAGWSSRALPLADGGEGTLDALLGALGGRRRRIPVTGPLGETVEAEYGVLPDGTAVVEMARASGLALVGDDNDPLAASTRGTGELIAAALRGGARRVIVGVGGSATTDGGAGALDALGWSLLGADVVVACDVTTTFVEAAVTFGPQKGAGPAEVEFLTRRLEGLAGEYEQRSGVAVASLVGSGAAGGLAGGLAALGARLRPGFEVVAAAVGLDAALAGASLVVTGEGRLDAASFSGKVVGEVVSRSEGVGVGHIGVIVGAVTPQARALVPEGVEVMSLAERAFDPEEAFTRAETLAYEAAVEFGRRAVASGGSTTTDGPARD